MNIYRNQRYEYISQTKILKYITIKDTNVYHN